jgi:hypothetical protein
MHLLVNGFVFFFLGDEIGSQDNGTTVAFELASLYSDFTSTLFSAKIRPIKKWKWNVILVSNRTWMKQFAPKGFVTCCVKKKKKKKKKDTAIKRSRARNIRAKLWSNWLIGKRQTGRNSRNTCTRASPSHMITHSPHTGASNKASSSRMKTNTESNNLK